MINSQRQAHDVRGLGYESVPPPFNENYSFLKTDEPSTYSKFEALLEKVQLPETTNQRVLYLPSQLMQTTLKTLTLL